MPDSLPPEDEIARLRAENEALRAERGDLQATFDLRWQADRRAIERWHAGGGNALTLPDHADLVVWLLEALAGAERLARSGDEVARIPSFGFTRGVIVREHADGPNMLVVRGMGETTVVLVIEGDEGGMVRLRERPTVGLHQVLAVGNYAKMVRALNDWEPDSASPSNPTTGGAA